MKYALIREHVGQYSIALMCRVLEVSRSGYYRWKDRPKSERTQRRMEMTRQVVDTYATFKARYGAPRIAQELNAIGLPCSTNYVADILQKQGLKARNGKNFRYSSHSLAMNNVSDNLLWRNFDAGRPNQKWTTDITYIWVDKQWLYLATVMDLYSRAIVGWALDTSMTEQLITAALSMAFDRREIEPGLIVHSDRGVQYRSQKYIDYLRSKGCKPSMSRKGNCWDNAPMESFFSRLKVELIYAEQYDSISEAKSGIFEYIEVFYNRLRRHSAIGYISPAEFERTAALSA
ncbi:IS3 family transposase [Gilvimarinus sp. F26214L]|uniref:IS3 family transposase n=1 Tax=Gilvimarinus sp. DZF01 TaxID=3461371 RepID=UPI004046349A